MIRHLKLTLLIISLSIFFTSIYAQPLTDSTISKINTLFKKWDKPNSPGCIVGIVKNDSLIFTKGYGMANLEYSVPISPETIFYMASVSKQFTAYSIVLLSKLGKIQLDEDVHTYLPYIPDFKKKITVRNLLNHTSGIRDGLNLIPFVRLGDDGIVTQELAVDIIKNQRTLNFNPGEEYSYSNSNYTLLAEIVKKVSGKSFRSFTDSAIFQPLGMSHTRFQDDYTELILNRAASYDRIDSASYSNNFQNVYALGQGGLFTSMIDMSKWASNFFNPKVGTAEDIKLLTTNGKLNNGKPINYAFGITSDTYKGNKVYIHTGGLAGYRTMICVFPDIKMSFVVFSNLGDFRVNRIWDVASLFIKDTTAPKQPKQPFKIDSSLAVLQDSSFIKNFTGDYLSNDGAIFTYNLRKGMFYWEPYGQKLLLAPAAKDSFYMMADSTITFKFSTGKDKLLRVDEYWPNNHRLLIKHDSDTSRPIKELQPYTGTYYSSELDCKYIIRLKGRQLFISNARLEDSPLQFTGSDDLVTKLWWMGHLAMIKDNKGAVTGFVVDDFSTKNLRFNKIQ